MRSRFDRASGPSRPRRVTCQDPSPSAVALGTMSSQTGYRSRSATQAKTASGGCGASRLAVTSTAPFYQRGGRYRATVRSLAGPLALLLVALAPIVLLGAVTS